MTPLIDRIREYSLQTFNYHTTKWGNNYLLSRRFNKENLLKNIITVDVIERNFKQLNKIYVCHTSDSCGLLYGIRSIFDCEIVVLTNHPLFERLHEYYNETLGKISYKKVDCIFENCFEYTTDGDLVLFPEMEYFVPMNYIKPPSPEQKIMCVYYVDDFNSVTQQNLLLSDYEVEDLFSFKQTIEFYKEKNSTNRYCYCGVGTL